MFAWFRVQGLGLSALELLPTLQFQDAGPLHVDSFLAGTATLSGACPGASKSMIGCLEFHDALRLQDALTGEGRRALCCPRLLAAKVLERVYSLQHPAMLQLVRSFALAPQGCPMSLPVKQASYG